MLNVPRSKVHPTSAEPKGLLASMEIFRRLPVEALREAEKTILEKKYSKGDSIFLEGDPADYVWFVKEGHVKAVIHSASGRDMTLCMNGSQALFGSCCCFGKRTYACNGVAETDVTILAYPIREFFGLLDRYPALSRAVVEELSKRLRQSKNMQAFEQETVEKRILHVLLNLVEEFGTTIPLTRREIAEMAGTTVETCIRTFSKLEGEGLVSTARGRIVIRNEKDLTERIEER